MELRFVFKSSSGQPRTHARKLPVIVGRADAPDIRLRIPKDSVSRRHCEFFLDDEGQVCIRDLKSTNGTFLDGRRIEPHGAAPLTPGRLITVGDVVFRVDYEAKSGTGADFPPGEAKSGTGADFPPGEQERDGAQGKSAPVPDFPTVPLEAAPLAAAAEEPTAEGDFGFLAGSEDGTAAEDAWPQAEGVPAEGEAGLEDFLKGLP